MKPARRFILMLGLFVAGATAAHAHAFPSHADPKVGSSVPVSPDRVTIWFSRNLEDGQSQIQVFDAKGNEVDRKDSKVDPAQKVMMTVMLPPLPPGAYTVAWSATCFDAHHTHGTYGFTIAP